MTHTVAQTLSAMKTQAKQQVPYGISRLLMSATLIVNGLILKQLDKKNNTNSNVAAGPLISAIQFLLLGIGRGYLITTGLKVSKIYGKHKNLLHMQAQPADDIESPDPTTEQENTPSDNISTGYQQQLNELCQEYNQAITQSLVLAGFITLIQLPICLESSNIVKCLNINTDIADNVYNYFMPFSLGLPAYNLYIVDTQIALATGRSHVTMPSGMLFCFTWLITSWALSVMKSSGSISGIGIGFALSSVINAILLRAYLMLKPFDSNINILKLNFDHLTEDLRQQLIDGSKLALQRLAEWGNISLLAFTFGVYGEKYLRAQQPSLQLTYIFTTTTLSMIQAQATQVKQHIAITNEGIISERYKDAFDCHKAAVLSGNAGIINGMLIGCAIATIFITCASQLSALFLNETDLNDDTIISVSNALFTLSGITIIIDSLRNYTTGALRGLHELSYPPLISALSMTPPLGIAIAVYHNEKDNYAMLYLSRLLGMMVAAVLISKKWIDKSNTLFKDLCSKADITEREYTGIMYQLDQGNLSYGTLSDHNDPVSAARTSTCSKIFTRCYNFFQNRNVNEMESRLLRNEPLTSIENN
jgi:Na+-driven multidrug efflux pump